MSANGCGPSWMPRFIKDMLFNWHFEAACNKHDIDYSHGGDEVRRFECDYNFWLEMKRVSKKSKGLFRFIRYAVACIYYIAARLLGKFSFTYR